MFINYWLAVAGAVSVSTVDASMTVTTAVTTVAMMVSSVSPGTRSVTLHTNSHNSLVTKR